MLGALIALAALTRGEALLLLPLLGLALVARGTLPRRERLVHLAVLVAAFALVLAPWSIRNATTFASPVLISTNGEGVWVGANCHQTYYGPIIGLWDFPCYGKTPPGDEAQQSREYRRRGMQYLRDHAGRVPLVLARARRAPVRRLPARADARLRGQRGPARRARSASACGCSGCSLRSPSRERGCCDRAPPAAAPSCSCRSPWSRSPALLTYGSTRFRFAAEPSIVVLAAVAVDALLRRRRSAA